MPKPEVSIGLALATGVLVFSIHQRGLPSMADQRASDMGDETLDTVRKQNLWLSAGVVSAISLIAKDPTIFIVGGGLAVVLDWLNRDNIWSDVLTNTIRGPEEMGDTNAMAEGGERVVYPDFANVG